MFYLSKDNENTFSGLMCPKLVQPIQKKIEEAVIVTNLFNA